MERVTHIDKDGWYINGSNVAAVFHSGTGEIRMSGKDIDRLAAYEDTGLEPETISKIRDIVLDISGDLDRLRELAQADREGRCVVLPCKPSDVTVYQLRNKKHARGIGVSPRHISCTSVWANGNYALHHQGVDDCLKRDFKKTWFLSEEEAEAALRRDQDG